MSGGNCGIETADILRKYLGPEATAKRLREVKANKKPLLLFGG